MGNIHLTWGGKIGYDVFMIDDVVSFVLRAGLVIAFWGVVWSSVKPRTQLLRICRAALLVLGLLGICAVLKLTGA